MATTYRNIANSIQSMLGQTNTVGTHHLSHTDVVAQQAYLHAQNQYNQTLMAQQASNQWQPVTIGSGTSMPQYIWSGNSATNYGPGILGAPIGSAGIISSVASTHTPENIKHRFFSILDSFEDVPSVASKAAYGDRVHGLRDRRQFDHEKVDLLGFIEAMLCNGIEPRNVNYFIEYAERVGVVFDPNLD